MVPPRPCPSRHPSSPRARPALCIWATPRGAGRLARARAAGGRFLLRLEDIDPARCRPAYRGAILEDLAWLGLDWDGPVRVQSAHLGEYCRRSWTRCGAGTALSLLLHAGRTSRAPATAPHGPDGPIYPGTCRDVSPAAERAARAGPAARAGGWTWRGRSPRTGPLSLTRKGGAASPATRRVWGRGAGPPRRTRQLPPERHPRRRGAGLSALVTRGADLACGDRHRCTALLQALMGWPEPAYCHHHPCTTGPDGAAAVEARWRCHPARTAACGDVCPGGANTSRHVVNAAVLPPRRDIHLWFISLDDTGGTLAAMRQNAEIASLAPVEKCIPYPNCS